MTDLAPDQKFGHYQLIERVGTGALGDVFRARDTNAGRTCLLKILPADFADRARFADAARTASALSHPAIAMLFEIDEAEGRPYVAYEFVQGETLRQALAGGAMHPRRAVPIALQIADALADAHAASIVHRDLKPDTIMLTPKGAAKVLDFGLSEWTAGGVARVAAAIGAPTDPASVPTTIAYMAPEQVLAQPGDARTDLYALGVMLYEMLTGKNPFVGPDVDTTLVNILKTRPDPPSQVVKDVPRELDEIVLRLLARDVQARYASAATVASDLRAAYGERTEHVLEGEEETPAAVVTPAARRRRALIPAAIIVLVIAAGAGLAYPRRDVIRGWFKHQFGPPPAPVIAVIPFTDESQSQTAFADGLAEDLMTRLGQTPGVTVVGRSAVRAFRGRNASDVARQAGASVVLTGTIQRIEGDLKIDLQLIDATDAVPVWTQEFTNPPDSVIAAQAVISDEVAKALKIQNRPSDSRERTLSRSVSPDAYDTYVRARAAFARRQYDSAIDLFGRAAKQDEGLAEAYAGLALALYRRAITTGGGVQPDVQAQVQDAVTRAAATDPDFAPVEFASALVAPTLREALKHLVRASTLDPSYAPTYRALADLIAPLDSARAGSLNSRARRLDPQGGPERMFETPASQELRSGLVTNREAVVKIVEEELRSLPK